MTSLHPVELFSLAVPPNGEPIPALIGKDEQATFRITMAAIDPTASTSSKGQTNGTPAFIGSVLRVIRVPTDDMSDDEDSDDESIDMAELLNGASDSESDSEEGPSDASKSPKAKRMAQLKEAIAQAQEDDDMDVDADLSSKAKGKARAVDEDEDDDLELDDEDIDGAEEFVLCTLDPTKAYQQTLDITVSEYETVYFRATGSHMVYLTGNVLAPVGLGADDYSDSEDEDDYDLPVGEDEGMYLSEDDESDELDDLEDPSRITELASEDEDSVPSKLIKAASGKGKNKRSAPDSSEIEEPAEAKPTVDSILEKSLKQTEVGAQPADEVKMSKTQLKKQAKRLKNNQGGAIDTTVEAKVNGEDKGVKAKEETPDKKVKFAKELVQGPSGSAQPNGEVAKAKTEKKAVETPKVNGEAKAANKSTRVVQGVTIDDKKLGSGPGAKKGDKVSMRYIGKLEKDKKIFDSNKKGPPFKFNLGKGEVIKGWDIGMQGIQVGGERRITVPANLAYGSKKMGDDIPANSALVFDVKCLEIK